MDEARVALARVDDWVRRLKDATGKEENVQRPTSNVQRPKEDFEAALDDDLNISGALGALFEAIRETNRRMDGGEMDGDEAKAWLEWWGRLDQILAISGEEAGVPAEIAALAEARVQARLAKDWRKSDQLRDELAARGWEARDTKDGQKVTRRGGA
jgi:cysteinyl-tRNA synthetase